MREKEKRGGNRERRINSERRRNRDRGRKQVKVEGNRRKQKEFTKRN